MNLKTKKSSSPFFLFSIVKNHLETIFSVVETKEKMIQLAYYIYLKDIIDKKIDSVLMKNNKKEIFKYLDNIDSIKSD